ncbi:hypothetical protein [Bosea sp. TND4EK4]|uniref:hypothetical protein n=1 Tax=Bosea sp. TND4EK4 TaxID=1907408 RepID=UPI0011157803|nr:hypothetical protein [Bosea sp. TND4EK4]
MAGHDMRNGRVHHPSQLPGGKERIAADPADIQALRRRGADHGVEMGASRPVDAAGGATGILIKPGMPARGDRQVRSPQRLKLEYF